MPQPGHGPARAAQRAVVVIAAGAVLAAGCGTTGGHPRTGSRTSAAAVVASPGTQGAGGPAAGSRAESARLARRILSLLVLPPGARRLGGHPLPRPLRAKSGMYVVSPSIDVHRGYWLPVPMIAAFKYLLAHPPRGAIPADGMSSPDQSGVSSENVAWSLRSAPAWAGVAEIGGYLVPDPAGGSFFRTDAEVAWHPPRSAAEHINPAAFGVVRIRADLLNPRPHSVTTTITSRPVIARLARLLNGLHAATWARMAAP
jgi:hypothetical protein